MRNNGKNNRGPSIHLGCPNHELPFEPIFWFELIEFLSKMVPCRCHLNLVSIGLGSSSKGLGPIYGFQPIGMFQDKVKLIRLGTICQKNWPDFITNKFWFLKIFLKIWGFQFYFFKDWKLTIFAKTNNYPTLVHAIFFPNCNMVKLFKEKTHVRINGFFNQIINPMLENHPSLKTKLSNFNYS